MSDDFVSEAMEEDFTSELPCTLAIESSAEDSAEPNETDQVSFYPPLKMFAVKRLKLSVCLCFTEQP